MSFRKHEGYMRKRYPVLRIQQCDTIVQYRLPYTNDMNTIYFQKNYPQFLPSNTSELRPSAALEGGPITQIKPAPRRAPLRGTCVTIKHAQRQL